MPTKQKSGLYRSKVKIGVDPSGKNIYKWISGKTQRELEAERRRVIAQYITGETPAEDCLMGAYISEWYRTRKRPFIEPSTQKSYVSMINKHFLPAFAERNLRSIRAIDLQAWLNTFAGQSDTTITLAATIIHGVMSAALGDGLIVRDPSAGLILPSPGEARRLRALTPDETARILHAIQEHENGPYLAVLYYMGLRPGEARGLQWGDIDWDTGTVHIQRDIDYAAKGDQVGKLKTTAGNRHVPMPQALRDILWPLRGLPTSYIFQGSKSGAPLSKSSAERIWLRLMDFCGLTELREKQWAQKDIRAQLRPLITPYYLRHNFITLCWEAGLDPVITTRIVGHEDYRTTANVYTHLNDQHLQTAKLEIDEIFSKKKVAQRLHKPL